MPVPLRPAALKTGADLAWVLCDPAAAAPIKAYSPELIVLPSPLASSCEQAQASAQVQPSGVVASALPAQEQLTLAQHLTQLQPKLSSAVWGPGMGLARATNPAAAEVLLDLLKARVPVVVDADGLATVGSNVASFAAAGGIGVLTPNVAEYKRLVQAVLDDAKLGPAFESAMQAAGADVATANTPSEPGAAALSHTLGGLGILAKGPVDFFAVAVAGDEGFSAVTGHWPDSSVSSQYTPSPRRCGGQGDVLAGTLATFLSWAAMRPAEDGSGWTHAQPDAHRLVAAMAGASALTRTAASAAFASHGRGTTTPDIIASLPSAFMQLFPERDS